MKTMLCRVYYHGRYLGTANIEYNDLFSRVKFGNTYYKILDINVNKGTAKVMKEIEYYRHRYPCEKCMSAKNVNAEYINDRQNILVYCLKCENLLETVIVDDIKEVLSHEE